MADHDHAIPAMPTAVATLNHCGPLALSATSSGLDVETQGSPEAGNVITPRPRLVRPMGEEVEGAENASCLLRRCNPLESTAAAI